MTVSVTSSFFPFHLVAQRVHFQIAAHEDLGLFPGFDHAVIGLLAAQQRADTFDQQRCEKGFLT